MITPGRLLASGLFVAIAIGPALGQQRLAPPRSLFDPRLQELRKASLGWDVRRGAWRVVRDQVVIVPDVATFLEVLGEWDDRSWFPILIDSPAENARFVRRFRPRRIVRRPAAPSLEGDDALWDAAQAIVSRSKMDHARRPPGLVLSFPASPSLAGAVALAVGRFQGLARWEPRARRGEPVDEAVARALAAEVEAVVASRHPRFGALGDDCDFLTLAADYPDRYRSETLGAMRGEAAFDDLIGRDPISGRRWAYAGRFGGDPTASVERAMASLFLPTDDGLLFDTYDPKSPGFRFHIMPGPDDRPDESLKLARVAGPAADLAGWHRAFRGGNGHDLVFVNTSGGPQDFSLMGGDRGVTADIPGGWPCAVLMNHSFSAARPDDPSTLAGAWLEGGAFVLYGSLNEPYIQAFRSPTLVLSLLEQGLPIAAAVRLLPEEDPTFGAPWRLHLLGDPWFRVVRSDHLPARGDPPPARPGEKMLSPEPPPDPNRGDEARLSWFESAWLLGEARGEPDREAESVLLSLRRDRLSAEARHRYDGILIGLGSRRPGTAFSSRLEQIPTPERGPEVGHAIDYILAARLQRAFEGGHWPEVRSAWIALRQTAGASPLRAEATRRVGRYVDRGPHRAAWVEDLQAAIAARPDGDDAAILRAELRRIETP